MQTLQTRQPEGGLLASQQWADFQSATGKKIIVSDCDDGTKIFGMINTLPIVGRYLYVPRLDSNCKKVIAHIAQSAYTHQCAWVRADTTHQMSAFARRAPHEMQPRCVFQMSLVPTSEDLLAKMKSKTRYNIRLALKKGVVIEVFRAQETGFTEAFEEFYVMIEATARRKGVRFHGQEYYKKMFSTLSADTIVLYIARYEGVVIAANIITFYNETATYLHGATSDKYRNVMAPFLLQWQAMQDAKAQNCKWYDFGGFFPESDDAGKTGITRFKKGFAPQTAPLCTQGTYDMVIAPIRYSLYRTLEKIKNIIR